MTWWFPAQNRNKKYLENSLPRRCRTEVVSTFSGFCIGSHYSPSVTSVVSLAFNPSFSAIRLVASNSFLNSLSILFDFPPPLR